MTGSHPSWSSILNFALLLGGLTYLLRKPLRQALFGRQEQIKDAVVESEALRRDAERMVREYEAKLQQLDDEIAQLLTEARADGEKERNRILEQARRTAERILEDARAAATRETQRVKRSLEREIVERALRQASESLKGSVTEKDHRLFAEELVSRLERGHGAN